MEVIQYQDKLEINTRETVGLVLSSIGFFGGLLIFALSVLSPLSSTDSINLAPLDGVIGVFFMIGCGLAALGADERKTILQHREPCKIITKRILRGKTFIQTFNVEDIVKIEFIHGFTMHTWGNRNTSHIFVVLKNGNKVEVLMRWQFKPLTFRRNIPPTKEASLIADFLNVPLDTVDITTLKKGIKNFSRAIDVSPHDPTRVVLQPPTQEKLNKNIISS